MLGVTIPRGSLYYHQERHRHDVTLNPTLRGRVETLARRMHDLFRAGRTPVVDRMPKCGVCSLEPLCQPQWSGRKAAAWDRWQKLLKQDDL